jgi:hypothetical protein
MKRLLSSLALLLLLMVPATAQEIGAVTIVEGPLRIMRGATVYQGSEGVRLSLGDIVESSPTGFVQMEFVGGPVVALGGSSRVLLYRYSRSSRGAGGATGEFILLTGWLKGERSALLGHYRYQTPLLAAAASPDGTVVVHSAENFSEIFVESGSARIEEVGPEGGGGKPRQVEGGQFSSRPANDQIAVSPRPSATFLQTLPRPFRDTIPSILSRFNGRSTPPKPDHEVAFSEIQPWFGIPPAWRAGLVRRFQSRLSDPEFRREVESHIREYPEWNSALHPEMNRSTIAPSAKNHSDATEKRNTN